LHWLTAGLYQSGGPGVSIMKMIAEYVDHARQFERLALLEDNPELKAQLERQAAAYRKLAAERAQRLGLDMPRDKRQPERPA